MNGWYTDSKNLTSRWDQFWGAVHPPQLLWEVWGKPTSVSELTAVLHGPIRLPSCPSPENCPQSNHSNKNSDLRLCFQGTYAQTRNVMHFLFVSVSHPVTESHMVSTTSPSPSLKSSPPARSLAEWTPRLSLWESTMSTPRMLLFAIPQTASLQGAKLTWLSQKLEEWPPSSLSGCWDTKALQQVWLCPKVQEVWFLAFVFLTLRD